MRARLTRMTPRAAKVRAAAETASRFRRFNLARRLNIFQIDACLADSAHAHKCPAPRAQRGAASRSSRVPRARGMFGDVYSNRGFAGETAGSSPGDAPGAHSPVRTRVLLVADEGGNPMASRPPLTPPRRREAASCSSRRARRARSPDTKIRRAEASGTARLPCPRRCSGATRVRGVTNAFFELKNASRRRRARPPRATTKPTRGDIDNKTLILRDRSTRRQAPFAKEAVVARFRASTRACFEIRRRSRVSAARAAARDTRSTPGRSSPCA